MEKEIILLTKSKKWHNYCIAGIDPNNGQWIRIISDNQSIQHAVEPKYTIYEDGCEAEIFDVISIDCTDEAPNYYQPENYIFDDEYYWNKNGQASLDKVIGLNGYNTDGYVFYNNDKKISKEDIEKIDESARYSLLLIEPEDVKIHVKYWEDSERTTVTACFEYNDESYNYISITDEEFINDYIEEGEGVYSLSDVYFVMSLADLNKDGYHYKLIASILYK